MCKYMRMYMCYYIPVLFGTNEPISNHRIFDAPKLDNSDGLPPCSTTNEHTYITKTKKHYEYIYIRVHVQK